MSGLPGPFEPSPTPFCACPVQHDALDCAEERCPSTPVELLDPCTCDCHCRWWDDDDGEEE